LFGVDRFGTLLFCLLSAFLISGAGSSGWPNVVGSIANVAALVAGFAATGLAADRRRLAVLVGIGVVSAVFVGLDGDSNLAAVGAFGQAIVLGAILLAVVRRVLQHDRVGLPTIAGAIAAYVLIGLVFSWVYAGLGYALNGPIFEPEVTGLPMYYSFVVLTTLGFGDVTPVDEFVQRLTAFEAMVGQIFLATLVARLVSMYGAPARRE